MDKLKEIDKPLFERYAITDSVVSLHHALRIENSNLKETGRLGIPLTISSLAGKILEKTLMTNEYPLPSKNGKYNVKNILKLYTPKGINLSGLSDWVYLFVASYRGGRNESYKYGVVSGTWYDYDLTGAYPTAMSMLNYPDYAKLEKISGFEFSTVVGKY